MSGRRAKKADRRRPRPWLESPWLSGLLLLGFSAYLAVSLVGGTGPWWLMVAGDADVPLLAPDNPGGPVGAVLSLGLYVVCGALWVWLVPLGTIAAGFGFLIGRTAWLRPVLWRIVVLWLATTAWLAQSGGPASAETAARLAGAVGFTLARGFHALFGPQGGWIVLTLLLLVVLTLVFRRWLGGLGSFVVAGLGRVAAGVGRGALLVAAPFGWLGAGFRGVRGLASGLFRRLARQGSAHDADRDGAQSGADRIRERRVHQPVESAAGPEPIRSVEDEYLDPNEKAEELVLPGATGEEYAEDGGESPAGPRPPKRKKVKRGKIVLPGLELLTPAGPDARPVTTTELDHGADLLEETLRSFGVEGEVKDVRPGPVVTTFEFQPGTGIRVNQIVQRSDDLALAMRARSLRMEAPIPGKAAVGIEIPNAKAQMVRLREVIELAGGGSREPLSVVLGKDVVGRPVSIDIASLPHLLVAGSTGSGKSVCLNAMLCHLLLRNTPETLRMVLIDPKMLEMNVYNGVPHLLLPVVTDPREALKALQWMVAQMEYRYRKLAKWSVRNIKQYNEKVARGEILDADGEVETEPMPYYLTVVDELADLMLQLGKDLEDLITRLAQKARAVGIHLVLATQRPSVDVITGVIKANIPCRIAFRVIQKNDSRTILDMNGAEQLLGYGDMLYLQPGRSLPVRVHGSFIDVDECEAIAAHWREYSGSTEEISLNEKPGGGGIHSGEDDLFDDAMRVVVLHQSGSTSLLQRRLRIGYTRAGRLMDMLEEARIVGPFTGSKARNVLIKPEDLPNNEQEPV